MAILDLIRSYYMDLSQNISIPLAEYLELKEAFDNKASVYYKAENFHTRKGKSIHTTFDSGWALIHAPGTEEEADIVRKINAEVSKRGNAYNTLYAALLGFLDENYSQLSRKLRKEIDKFNDIEEWFKETILERSAYPVKTTPDNIHLPEGYIIVKDEAGPNEWKVVKVEETAEEIFASIKIKDSEAAK
jgi:hypothetical protein